MVALCILAWWTIMSNWPCACPEVMGEPAFVLNVSDCNHEKNNPMNPEHDKTIGVDRKYAKVKKNLEKLEHSSLRRLGEVNSNALG